MSTSYYRINPPITHLRIEDGGGGHDKISVWVSHGFSGSLIVSKRERQDILRIFACYESPCPLRTYSGNETRGVVVTVNDKTLPDEACVISEYGELFTVGEVKARDGVKRSDGMPAELFGYEKTGSTRRAG